MRKSNIRSDHESGGRAAHPRLEVEQIPPRCQNGHPWGQNLVLVGWLPCECRRTGGGHRTYRCRRCDAVTYRPEHRDGTAIQDSPTSLE